MAVEVGGGRPQHMSAWCKERLGWLTPAVIDPTLKQDLVLAAVENTNNQSFKIPVAPTAASTSSLRIGSGSASTRVFRAQAC